MDLNALAIWNDIAAPYTIFVGQKISLFNSLQAHKPRLQKSSKSSETLPKASGTVQKVRISSQKKLALSIDNRKVLKFYCAWPLKGKVVRSFSQTGNKGIDISAQLGRPVKAAAAGTVVYSGQGLLGYGKLLIIKHNEEFLSAYGNNSKLLVKEGQQVKKGRIIAEAGIGAGNKAALHFEIRKNGEPVNPIDYLPR
ncbi:MAG: murein hydrolase activator EnvC family protein [Gammaproteobacteria bacterium]